MRRLFITVTLLVACSLFTKAQTFEAHTFDSGINRDFEWAQFDHDNFDLTSYSKDPSADAVVVKEFGKAWITSNGDRSTFMLEYHVKIKTFTEKGLRKGHVVIPYYIQDSGTYEEVTPESVHGVTYYYGPDGGMHSVDLSPDSVTVVKKSKHWSAIVFTMPKLSKGCMIEYKYTLTSPFLDNFRTWKFQSDIPKMYSEYEAHIPKVFGYNISLRGSLPLTSDYTNTDHECFESTTVKSDCHVEDYRINDIPAFKTEPYMESPNNYLSALYFQATEITKLNNFVNLDQATETSVLDWTDADKSLRFDEKFGDELRRAPALKDKIPSSITGIKDTLEKAKAVYAFIQKSIKFDGQYNIHTDNGVKKAFDKHFGNSADVNISLTDALIDAGIKAEAVIISTRDNGIVTNVYPAVTEFNSVITAVYINGKAYLLDATAPLLPFGMLPVGDLNGRGRVMPLNKPSYWIEPVTPQQQASVTIADLTLDAGNNLTGTVTRYSKNYSAYERRATLATYKSSAYNRSVPGAVIVKSSNIAADAGPSLTETYQVKVNNQDKNGAFSFEPFMLGKPVNMPYELLDTLTDNPFVETTRNYPIDFGMPSSRSFTCTLHLPTGYKVENPPQSVEDSIPGLGNIIATFNADETTATYTLSYNLDKAVYTVAEYAKLRALFDKIILAEKAPVIIKKE